MTLHDGQREDQPLLGSTLISGDDEGHFGGSDFDQDNFAKYDAENPLNWRPRFKWCIVVLLACMAFTVTFTCTSIVPIAGHIVEDLSGVQSNKSASTILVTIWELGEALGPLLIAPLSEVYGRYPVMNSACALFIVTTVLAALSNTTGLFIASRAMTGVAVAANVLNPAIVADMFMSDERGSPMSLIQISPLLGGAIGPAISGTIAETLGWRKVVWISVILAATCEALFLTCFKETYKLVIIRKHAARLQREGLRVERHHDFSEPSRLKFLGSSCLRPAVVLAGSSVLIALSMFSSVVFAQFYVFSVTLPDILQTVYGVSPGVTGVSFVMFSIGALFSIIICNTFLDRIYVSLRKSGDGFGRPEYRLPLMIVGGLMIPLAMALYGWSAQLQLPLAVLLLSVAILGATIMLAYIPVMAYVVDAFGHYSASAVTGVIVTRCLMGTFLPLTAYPLVLSVGYGWAMSILGGINLALAAIPLVLLRYGADWRKKSSFTREC